MPGLVHVYTGDGKGKTTAAFGLALRQAGAGGRAAVIQFLKGRPSAEVRVIQDMGVKCIIANPGIPFTGSLNPKEYGRHREMAKKAFLLAGDMMKDVDMLILDEVICAVNCGFINLCEVLELIREKPASTELVLTGINAPEEICAAADYVSNIQKLKHPFDKGIPAREGIEF